MANEKILIITLGKTYDPAVIAGFTKNGWSIEHERPSEEEISEYRAALDNPMIAAFVDRTGSISDEFLHEMKTEVDGVMKMALPTPESFQKVSEIIKKPFPDHKGWVEQKIDDLVASRKK